MISAKEANHKFAVETKLLTDKETINYIVKRNKTFGEKIVNGINRMIQRTIGSKEQKFLAGIRTKWEAALEESRKTIWRRWRDNKNTHEILSHGYFKLYGNNLFYVEY